MVDWSKLAWTEHVCTSIDKRFDVYYMPGVVSVYFAHVPCKHRSVTVESVGPEELLKAIHELEHVLCS